MPACTLGLLKSSHSKLPKPSILKPREIGTLFDRQKNRGTERASNLRRSGGQKTGLLLGQFGPSVRVWISVTPRAVCWRRGWCRCGVGL